jgi:type III pantothenate kinase
MDINLLVVSLGNTRIALAAFIEGEFLESRRVPHGDLTALRQAVTELWAKVGSRESEVAGASVNPGAVEAVEHVIHEVTGESVQWVGRDVPLPRKVLTDNPSTTGVDRVLGVAAAFEQLGKACVVVDAGTAVTVNFCDDKGNFLGGAIGPGVSLQLKALHERTAALPLITADVPKGLFGASTEEAIRHAVFHGIRGMVKELVENFATHLGSWPELIATGGDAELLFKDWELVHAISPDLVLYGIALAFAEGG